MSKKILFIIIIIFSLTECKLVVPDYSSSVAVLASLLPRPKHSLNVNVQGLVKTGMILQNNGVDDLEVPSDGEYTFTSSVREGSNYLVTIFQQPNEQTCSVSNGEGTMGNSEVTVEITCDPFFSLELSVSDESIQNEGSYIMDMVQVNIAGLSEAFTLKNNGNTEVKLTGNPKVQIADLTDLILDVSSLPETIQVGGSSSFQIQFSPTTWGEKSTTLSIPTNEGTFSITLKAFACNPLNSASFASKTDYSIYNGSPGYYPYDVKIGDIDGDSKNDVVVVFNKSNLVSVFRNTSSIGSISLASKVDFVTGSQPRNVSVGDLDGDGKLDLVVTNSASNTISIFRNTSSSGSISFASKQDFATSSIPQGVVLSDIDGDGKLDVVVGNRGASTISTFLNTSSTGSISLAAKQDFTTGTGPRDVGIADIDGDGKKDVVTANYDGMSFSVLLNTSTTGGITFSPKTDVSHSGISPIDLTLGDIDGDGLADIVVASYYSYRASIYRNTSSIGSVSFATRIDLNSIGYNANVESVKLGDIDGDGKLDVVPFNFHQYVERNTSSLGSISFAGSLIILSTRNGNSNFNRGAIGDLDGDGLLDLASISIDGILAVYRNTSSVGSVSMTSGIEYPTASNLRGLASADLNGDLKPEVVISDYTFYQMSILQNTSNPGTIAFGTKIDLSTGIDPHGIDIGEADDDGLLDLAVANWESHTLSVFRNLGSLSFANKVDFSNGSWQTRVAGFLDFDGDGKQDFLMPNWNGNTLSIFKNTSSTNSISAEPRLDILANANLRDMEKADFDGDGKIDLAVLSFNTLSIYQNNSSIGSIALASKSDTATSPSENMSVGDMDGDGKVDIILSRQGNFSVLRNSSSIGSISFAGIQDFPLSFSCSKGIVVQDLDGDRLPDVVVTEACLDKVYVFRNTSSIGSLSFGPQLTFSAGYSPQFVIIQDLDLDKKPDIIVANQYSSLSVFRNKGE